VFVCSFIPVLGVVLSSVPISVMAIVQPDGTVLMAVYIILAVLVIHFIETSILNPKILGDMLHLHPVLVLAVLAIGEHFAGVWGLLLGVPVAVYIIRCVILNEEIPGLIEQSPLPEDRLAAASAGAASSEAFQIDVSTFAPEKGHDADASGAPRGSSPGGEGDEDAAPEASIVTGARDTRK